MKEYTMKPARPTTQSFRRHGGYVALASSIVIAAMVLTITITLAALSISEAQQSLANKKNEESLDFVEGCVEDTLIRLNKNNTIPTQIALPEGECTITTDAQSGNDWTFTVSGAQDGYTKHIQVVATRESTVTIQQWEEVDG